MPQPRLYVFNISHFSEKARWALEHKRVQYQLKVLLPGPHVLTTRRLSDRREVPLLFHDGAAVQGSSRIIDHIERAWPERPLAPARAGEEIAALEAELDREVGENARRVLYSLALDRPEVVIPMFSAGGPRWAPVFYRFAFRRLAAIIRRQYKVNADRVARSREEFAAAIARLEARLRGRRYLVGDALSRADLTAAAMLAPLVSPPEHPMRWRELTAGLPGWQDFAGSVSAPVVDYVRRIYRDHRT